MVILSFRIYYRLLDMITPRVYIHNIVPPRMSVNHPADSQPTQNTPSTQNNQGPTVAQGTHNRPTRSQTIAALPDNHNTHQSQSERIPRHKSNSFSTTRKLFGRSKNASDSAPPVPPVPPVPASNESYMNSGPHDSTPTPTIHPMAEPGLHAPPAVNSLSPATVSQAQSENPPRITDPSISNFAASVPSQPKSTFEASEFYNQRIQQISPTRVPNDQGVSSAALSSPIEPLRPITKNRQFVNTNPGVDSPNPQRLYDNSSSSQVTAPLTVNNPDQSRMSNPQGMYSATPADPALQISSSAPTMSMQAMHPVSSYVTANITLSQPSTYNQQYATIPTDSVSVPPAVSNQSFQMSNNQQYAPTSVTSYPSPPVTSGPMQSEGTSYPFPSTAQSQSSGFTSPSLASSPTSYGPAPLGDSSMQTNQSIPNTQSSAPINYSKPTNYVAPASYPSQQIGYPSQQPNYQPTMGYPSPPTSYPSPPMSYPSSPTNYTSSPTSYPSPPMSYPSPPTNYTSPPSGYVGQPTNYPSPLSPQPIPSYPAQTQLPHNPTSTATRAAATPLTSDQVTMNVMKDIGKSVLGLAGKSVVKAATSGNGDFVGNVTDLAMGINPNGSNTGGSIPGVNGTNMFPNMAGNTGGSIPGVNGTNMFPNMASNFNGIPNLGNLPLPDFSGQYQALMFQYQNLHAQNGGQTTPDMQNLMYQMQHLQQTMAAHQAQQQQQQMYMHQQYPG